MSLRSPPSGADDGAPPPERTPEVSPITFSCRRDRFEGLRSNLHPKLQTISILATNWYSADSSGRESGRGRLWCPLGWRRTVVRPNNGKQRDVRTLRTVWTSGLRTVRTSGEITQNFKQDQSRRKTGKERTRR
ncbi:hypothetical protein ACLB2K_033383 [Fragaria x ananassa]